MCLSLHIEVLSFEDSEWSRGRYKMECQMEKLEHFRHILLFEFNRGAEAEEAARNICAVYGDNAIGERTTRKWFSLFKEDHYTLVTLHVQEDTIIHVSVLDNWQILWTVNIPQSCDICIQWARFKKSSVWVPHALRQNHKNKRMAICPCLLARRRLAREQHWPFLSSIVTGDKKWCFSANISKRKGRLYPNKIKHVGNVPISPLGTPYSSVHGSTHYLQMTKLHDVNSSTIIELQIKNDNR